MENESKKTHQTQSPVVSGWLHFLITSPTGFLYTARGGKLVVGRTMYILCTITTFHSHAEPYLIHLLYCVEWSLHLQQTHWYDHRIPFARYESENELNG